MPRNLSFFCLFFLIFWSACAGDISHMKPGAGGRMAEVVLVFQDNDIKTSWADSIQYFFSRPMPILPQDEAAWDVIRVGPSSFNNLFKVHRNVIKVQLSSAQKEPAYKVEKNVYASGQVLITLAASNEGALLSYFGKVKGEIESILRENDFSILRKEYHKILNREAQNRLKEISGLKLTIPSGFFSSIDTVDFSYFVHDAIGQTATDRGSYDAKVQRSIWAATGNYTGPELFTRKEALRIRDSITEKYILSSKPGSFMMTEPIVPTDSMTITYAGERALVQRGLWRMKNEFKGGPYLNIISYNPQTKKWIMLDAFVYAPQFEKRNYMLQLDCILSGAER